MHCAQSTIMYMNPISFGKTLHMCPSLITQSIAWFFDWIFLVCVGCKGSRFKCIHHIELEQSSPESILMEAVPFLQSPALVGTFASSECAITQSQEQDKMRQAGKRTKRAACTEIPVNLQPTGSSSLPTKRIGRKERADQLCMLPSNIWYGSQC